MTSGPGTAGQADSSLDRGEAGPGGRAAQRALAREATALVHGPAAAAEAESAAECLFNGNVAALPLAVLLEGLRGVPTTAWSLAELQSGPRPMADVLVA